MQNYAQHMVNPQINISNDVGNVIELGGNDIDDDLGMSLLANTRVNQSRPVQHTTVQVPVAERFNDFTLAPLEPLESVLLDIPTFNGNSGNGTLPEIHINRSEETFPAFSDNTQTATGPGISLSPPPQRMSYEEERRQKADLITKLARLESKGYQLTKRFTMDNSFDEIKQEFERLTDAKSLEASVKWQRQMMMGFVTGVELMNKKFNPFDWELEGWSESVHENVDDYDEVFEELYDKYKGRGNMPPEAKFLFMLAGSGFMFHMSNSFFRSKVNNMSMEDIFKANPALRQQFSMAAAQAAGPGFGNFMNMTMGGPSTAAQQAPMPPQNQFFNPPNAPPQAMAPSLAPIRREMKGPSGVDDILKTFEEVRNAELQGHVNSVFTQPAMPSPPNGSTTQPARQALAEIQSIHSDEAMSQTESIRTGRTTGGSRKRKAQVPLANTFQLNV